MGHPASALQPQQHSVFFRSSPPTPQQHRRLFPLPRDLILHFAPLRREGDRECDPLYMRVGPRAADATEWVHCPTGAGTQEVVCSLDLWTHLQVGPGWTLTAAGLVFGKWSKSWGHFEGPSLHGGISSTKPIKARGLRETAATAACSFLCSCRTNWKTRPSDSPSLPKPSKNLSLIESNMDPPKRRGPDPNQYLG